MPASTTDTHATAILDAFAAVARPIIRREYRADSCIASTRIALDCLRHFGLRAEPLVARMTAYNAAMLECLERCPEPSVAMVDEWAATLGAHSVGVGYGPAGPNEWPGHLVAVVSRTVLVDASADQASRPQHHMTLPGVLVAPAEVTFVSGLRPAALVTPEGSLVIYQPDPKDQSYRLSTLV